MTAGTATGGGGGASPSASDAGGGVDAPFIEPGGFPVTQGFVDAARVAWTEAQAPHEVLAFEPTLIRLGAALLLGAAIGMERERQDKPAGLRTHMLISLASALFVIIALEIGVAPGQGDQTLEVDPSRVVEAVTAGVAFLAAGSIIRSGRDVKGVTTGAAMWLTSAVGVACGVGYLKIAAIVAAAAVAVLFLIRAVEKR